MGAYWMQGFTFKTGSASETPEVGCLLKNIVVSVMMGKRQSEAGWVEIRAARPESFTVLCQQILGSCSAPLLGQNTAQPRDYCKEALPHPAVSPAAFRNCCTHLSSPQLSPFRAFSIPFPSHCLRASPALQGHPPATRASMEL